MHLQAAVRAGFIAILGSVVPSASGLAQDVPHIVVNVVNEAGVSATVLEGAHRRVTRIFGLSGLRWSDPHVRRRLRGVHRQDRGRAGSRAHQGSNRLSRDRSDRQQRWWTMRVLLLRSNRAVVGQQTSGCLGSAWSRDGARARALAPAVWQPHRARSDQRDGAARIL